MAASQKQYVMKTTMIKTIGTAFLFAGMITLNSCNKDKSASDFTAADNQALADETYNDVHNVSDEASQTGSVSYKDEDANSLLSGCAVVTRDTISAIRTTTIDFGTGCTGIDGKTRKGKILISYDGPYRAQGTTITVTFQDFFVNDNQVLGTKTIHNDGLNGAGNPSFSIHVQGQIILANNAGTIIWTSDRTREWIAGAATPQRDDDQYSITGTASGTDSEGNPFTCTIVDPLIRNLAPGCRRHFVKGSVLIQRSGKPDKSIDFGNGDCDNQAVVTVNGTSHIINLH